MAFIAVRPIDLAIFGSLGLLWIGGALFIVVLYRWIARFEREQDPQDPALTPIEAPKPIPARAPSRIIPQPATAREALARN
jgi:hypothetical protein